MGKNEIFLEALSLQADDRFLLIEELLKSLSLQNQEIDKLWQEESENRIKAYENGEISSIAMEEVFGKYQQN